MKLAVCLVALFLVFTVSLFGQTERRKPTPKRPDIDRKAESDCGVLYSAREFVEELKVEWRVAGETNDDVYYYNTKKMECVQGVLKAWVKQVAKETNSTKGISPYSMQRVELNCRTAQIKLGAKTIYGKKGQVLGERPAEPDWTDVVPDSLGEGIWETICRKSR